MKLRLPVLSFSQENTLLSHGSFGPLLGFVALPHFGVGTPLMLGFSLCQLRLPGFPRSSRRFLHELKVTLEASFVDA